MKRIGIFAVLALVFVSCSSDSDNGNRAATPAAKFESGPCPQTPAPVPALANARCGTLVVPENRTKDNGRTIRLAVAIVPSQSPTPAPDPVMHIAGGPGNDAILFSDTVIGAGANRDRDVIFMSVRGATTSRPSLVCPELDRHDDALLGEVYGAPSTGEKEIVATRLCRDRLVAENDGIDLSAYNSTEAAADYAGLRTALGVKEWNVFGHSYGTDLTLQMMRLYPEGIRTVVLDGVVPPNEASPIAWPWKSAKEAFSAVFVACSEQPPCAARYPGLSDRFTELVNRLEANPVRTTVNLPDGTPREVVMDGGALSNWMVRGMHHPADVPQWLDEMANGRPEKIATQWASGKAFDPETAGTVSFGYYYGVTCSEWVPYTSAATELEEARRAFPGFPESVLAQGPQLPFLREACEVWDVAKAPESVRDLPQTNLRTLVMSGTFDAQTGAQWGDLVAGELPNSVNVRFPGVAHGPFVRPCGGQVMLSFWNTPDAPDTSCVASVTVPPFVIG